MLKRCSGRVRSKIEITMKFTKMQGTGNDFVVIATEDTQRDWSRLATKICDRHYGIGADSLLLLLPSDAADFAMRTLDADGSEAETCGNGLRCLVKYFVDKGLARPGAQEISVATVAGVRQAWIYATDGKVAKVEVGMGEPKFELENIPAAVEPGTGKPIGAKSMMVYPIILDGTELKLSLISLGNPHAVHFSQAPVSGFPLGQLGPQVERHKIFPRRTNFEVARVLSRRLIEARVWERGVGETLSCGSGACAITVAAHLHGYVDKKVEIKLPGGILGVKWDGVGEVFLSGPAETVFTGEWLDEDLDQALDNAPDEVRSK